LAQVNYAISTSKLQATQLHLVQEVQFHFELEALPCFEVVDKKVLWIVAAKPLPGTAAQFTCMTKGVMGKTEVLDFSLGIVKHTTTLHPCQLFVTL